MEVEGTRADVDNDDDDDVEEEDERMEGVDGSKGFLAPVGVAKEGILEVDTLLDANWKKD